MLVTMGMQLDQIQRHPPSPGGQGPSQVARAPRCLQGPRGERDESPQEEEMEVGFGGSRLGSATGSWGESQ